MAEDSRIGGSRSLELAVSARISIHLARTRQARHWERDNIVVDSEYAQQGLAGLRKGAPGVTMRPDLIVHKRGELSSDWNWLVCEIKLHDHRPNRVHAGDLRKLKRCVRLFNYGLAIWLSLPRSTYGDQTVFYSAIQAGIRPAAPLPIE